MGKFFEVHNGTTRTVFLIGKYAVKIPVLNSWRGFLKGLLANCNERNIWHLCPNYFIPVLWSLPGGWLVCMPRARTTTKEGPWYYCFMADLFHGDNDDITEALTARRYCEPFYKNIGWYKGKPICIDYGTHCIPDNTEEALNSELFYLKVKTTRLNEEIRNGTNITEIQLSQKPAALAMVYRDLSIPAIKNEIPRCVENDGLLKVEEAV